MKCFLAYMLPSCRLTSCRKLDCRCCASLPWRSWFLSSQSVCHCSQRTVTSPSSHCSGVPLLWVAVDVGFGCAARLEQRPCTCRPSRTKRPSMICFHPTVACWQMRARRSEGYVSGFILGRSLPESQLSRPLISRRVSCGYVFVVLQ